VGESPIGKLFQWAGHSKTLPGRCR
jgi:hypothetical protein